jgi:hypothetical protein
MTEDDCSNEAGEIDVEDWLTEPAGDEDFEEVSIDELEEFSARVTEIGALSSSITPDLSRAFEEMHQQSVKNQVGALAMLDVSNQVAETMRQLSAFPFQEVATRLTGLEALTAAHLVTDFEEIYTAPRVAELASVVNQMPMNSLQVATDSWATSVASLVAQQFDTGSLIHPAGLSVFAEEMNSIGAETSIGPISPSLEVAEPTAGIYESSSSTDATDPQVPSTDPIQTNDLGYFRLCILPLVDYTLDRTVEMSKIRELEPRHRATITASIYFFLLFHPDLAEPEMAQLLPLVIAHLVDVGVNSRSFNPE